MTSTPREKDTWLKSLKKVIGDRCIETIEIKKPEPNLERSDSTRSDVKSLTILDVQEKEDIMIRSFSTGSTGVTKRAPLISNGPSPSPEVPLAVPDHQVCHRSLPFFFFRIANFTSISLFYLLPSKSLVQ